MRTPNNTFIACVSCSCEVKSLEPQDVPCEIAMYDGGLVHKIVAGYGSVNDSDTFLIGICDPCIDSLVKKGLLIRVPII